MQTLGDQDQGPLVIVLARAIAVEVAVWAVEIVTQMMNGIKARITGKSLQRLDLPATTLGAF